MPEQFHLSDDEKAQVAWFLDELNGLGIHPLHFLIRTVRAEVALRKASPDLYGANLGRAISAMLAADPDRAESPWMAPSAQSHLFSWRFRPAALAEILRYIARELDPPKLGPGRRRSDLDKFERQMAGHALWNARRLLREARTGRAYEEEPRVRETLALRLDAKESACVLAFAKRTGFSGPLEDVDVDEAVRYFDRARKGK